MGYQENLTRGKRLDNGKWVYWTGLGKLTESQSGKLMSGKVGYTDWAYELLTTPYTEGRYIGKLDKNGKKIFHGDVVKHYYNSCDTNAYNVVVIEWDEKKFRWCKRDLVTEERYEIWDTCILEVIGNIHDNPELVNAG